MSTHPGIVKYSGLARLLHWLISPLIILQFILVWTADTLPRGDETKAILMATHKSVGITVLALVIVRIIWRFLHTPPAFPNVMSVVDQWIARITHWALYVLILLMPLSGWLMSTAAGRDTQWFWLFTLPRPIGENETAFDVFHEMHEILAWVLLVTASLHILAALWHAVVKKDGILRRMI